MTVTPGKNPRMRFTARLNALALGAALLALPGAALAQQDEHHRDGGGGGATHAQQAPRPAPAAPAPRAAPPMERAGNERGPGQWNAQSRPAPGNPGGNGGQSHAPQPNAYAGHGRPAFQGQPQGQPGWQGQPRGDGDRHDGGGQWHGDAGPGGRNDGQWRGGPGYGGPRDGGDLGAGQWSHGWREDQRYDWRGWRNANRDVFHTGRYYPPYRDFYYNRLGVGFYLQPLFFGPDYWIGDPGYYHLPPAYGPYHWVRYFNDVILVNTYTGQVADVIYDFFW